MISRYIQPCLFEEHASVLTRWFDLGIRDRTLICFDAHFDLQQISTARLDRLRASRTRDELQRQMKPHHLMPDQVVSPSLQFSYSIEDFLFAATRLGLIIRIIWVAPPHISIVDMQSAIEQLQQCDGVTIESLAGLQRWTDSTNQIHWITGRLLDVDLTVCHREALPHLQLSRDSLVDIDIDYFVELPSEQIGTPIADVVDDLLNLDLNFGEVTISRSVLSGFTPIHLRGIAEQLAERFAGTAASDIELLARDAGSLSFADDLLRRACEFPARGREVLPAAITSLEHECFALSCNDHERALISAALGILWCHVGNVEAAIESYRTAASVFGGHPELALEIAKLCLQTGHDASVDAFLHDALRDDKTGTAAQYCLGVVAMNAARGSGDSHALNLAIEHWEIANQRAPAWGEVLQLLADAHHRRADLSNANLCSDRWLRLQQVIARNYVYE